MGLVKIRLKKEKTLNFKYQQTNKVMQTEFILIKQTSV